MLSTRAYTKVHKTDNNNNKPTCGPVHVVLGAILNTLSVGGTADETATLPVVPAVSLGRPAALVLVARVGHMDCGIVISGNTSGVFALEGETSNKRALHICGNSAGKAMTPIRLKIDESHFNQ